jgi:hypothetical protein
MSRALLISALAASGCIVVTQPLTREVVVGVSESEPTDSGGAVAWDITTRIEADMANVVVTASRVQPCTRVRSEVYDVYDELDWHTVGLPGGGGSAGGALALGVAAIVFLPVTVVSWVVAKVEISNHPETKTRKTRALRTIPGVCRDVAANVPVELVLPSGTALTGMTGVDGRASFAIPEAEPDDGTMVTRVAEETRPGAFFKTTEACERARDEMFSRIVKTAAVEQRSPLLRSLPTACGDARARAWSLTAKAALDAVALRCESTKSVVNQVRSLDREVYNSSVSEPDIAQCLDGSAVARQRHATCVEQRRDAMLHARQIDDIKERTRILTSLPNCDALLRR